MRIAVMQPYIFPYLPYFQLVHAVDCFVFLDTVQFLKRGWMHRNRIKLGDKDHLFTLPVRVESRNSPVTDVVFAENIKAECETLKRKLEHAYRKANSWSQLETIIWPLMDDMEPGANFSDFAGKSVQAVSDAMGITTDFRSASALGERTADHYQDYILDICQELGATTYVNPIGGMDIYSPKAFAERNVDLRFLSAQSFVYPQPGGAFVENLSIVDVLANVPLGELGQLLDDYELIPSPAENTA
ncbi:MAG: WbqC family protein [Silicimonas sp.]|nr:WbqC family protein [Silicimonas sp.]